VVKLKILAGTLILLVSGVFSLPRVDVRAADDPQPGRHLFVQCLSCHTTLAEGQYRQAPPLNGIVGRKIASVPGFRYSEALLAETGVWTRKKLDNFLKKPRHAVAKTRMYFRGLRNPADRAALISWLASAKVPSVVAAGDRSFTAPVTVTKKPETVPIRPCMACHNFVPGGPNNIGPNLNGVVGRPVASAPNFSYSDSLAARGGIWTPKRLDDFFSEKKQFDQGSHIAFRLLQTPEARKEIIAWLQEMSAPDE